MPGPSKLNESSNIPRGAPALARLFFHADPITGIAQAAEIQELAELFEGQAVTTFPTFDDLLDQTTLPIGSIAYIAATGEFYFYQGPDPADPNSYVLMNPPPFEVWEAKTYEKEIVYVLYDLDGFKQFFRLANATRPYVSSNFLTEYAAGDWELMSERGIMTITKSAHGFNPAEVLTFKSGAWNLYATGDKPLAIVTNVINTNNVIVALLGFLVKTIFSGWTPGDIYYLQPTGTLNNLLVTDKPILMAIASNRVIVFSGAGSGGGGGGGAMTASNGLNVVSSDIRLGGPITLATLLEITTGSLTVGGADKALILKSNSGIKPKLAIEGDGVNTDGRNFLFEPQLISGFIRGLLWSYSNAHNSAATLPAIFVRDNGWIYFGATSEGGGHMIYRPNGSLAVGNNIQNINDNDFIQGANISNLGTQGRNILKGQNYNLKGTSYGNFLYADSPDNGAASMNNLFSNLILAIGATVSVQELAGSILSGDDYLINQPSPAPEFQGLYNILMGNHNKVKNTHHLFQFGTGLDNQYNNSDHGNWKYQPKFCFGNANVPMGTLRATFVIANGFVGSFKSHSLTHLADGWTQINTTNTKGFEGGGTDVNLSAADVTPKAAFEVVSTTSGILVPRMSTAQKSAIVSPLNGLVIYDSTLNEFQFYQNGAWVGIPSGGGGGGAPAQLRFRFNSSLYTEDEHLFKGPITSITATKSNNIGSFTFEAKLDDGSDTYHACADVTALLAWLAINVTVAGTTFWIKALATYGATPGIGEILFVYS